MESAEFFSLKGVIVGIYIELVLVTMYISLMVTVYREV
jgi:hypothetical protein